MFTIAAKSETSLTIEWALAHVPKKNTPIHITAKNQINLLYQYVNHVDFFISLTLDHIYLQCDDVRKNYHHWGMGSLLNETQTKSWWKWLAKKERWQRPDKCRRFTYEEILETDWNFMAPFGSNVHALVKDLVNAAKNALATMNKISEIHESMFDNISKNMAS
jgi:hypothetical protein